MRFGPFTPQDQLTITTLGLEFAVAVALGTGGGLWADRHFDSLPWLTVIGMFAGFALGMYILVKESRRMARQEAPHKDEKEDGSH